MPDNITITPGTGATVTTEDVGGGVQVQRVKLITGALHTDGGDVTVINPFPVADATVVAAIEAIPSAPSTVTANAGTNLNTSALALESGGNLAAIKADTDKIPSQGQALAAASLPVVLPVAQISALTPPAAITGFALESGGHLASLDTKLANPLPVSLPSAQISTLTPPAAITGFALETGGNLAAIKADVDKIPSLGQADSAHSLPVVLPSSQISALTPPSAITNYAAETGGHLASLDTKLPSQGQADTSHSIPVVLPSAQISILTPPAAITGFALETGGNLAGAKSDLDAIKTSVANIPSSPAQDRTTAAAPLAVNLSTGAAFYDARQVRALTSGTDTVTTSPPSHASTNIDQVAGSTPNFAQETGGNLAILAGVVSSSKAAVKSADGDFATVGAKADAPATTATTDAWSVIALLKGLLKIFLDVWNGTTHALGVTFTNTTIAVTGAVTTSGTTTATTNADVTPTATAAPSKGLLVVGKTADGTPAYDALPLAAGGGSVVVSGAVTISNKLLVTPDSVALPAHQSTNIDQIAGTTPDTNSGNKSAGTLRVVLATDQPQLTTALNVVEAQNSTITSGQTTINPAAAMLPSHAGKSVKIQSSYANIASGLIIYVGASGSEVIELIAGDTWTFNVSNLNLISAKCTAAMTAALNWIVES